MVCLTELRKFTSVRHRRRVPPRHPLLLKCEELSMNSISLYCVTFLAIFAMCSMASQAQESICPDAICLNKRRARKICRPFKNCEVKSCTEGEGYSCQLSDPVPRVETPSPTPSPTPSVACPSPAPSCSLHIENDSNEVLVYCLCPSENWATYLNSDGKTDCVETCLADSLLLSVLCKYGEMTSDRLDQIGGDCCSSCGRSANACLNP